MRLQDDEEPNPYAKARYYSNQKVRQLRRWAVVDKKARKVMPVENCGDYNRMTELTERKWTPGVKAARNRAEQYLRMMNRTADPVRRNILVRGPKSGLSKELEKWAEEQPGGAKSALQGFTARKAERGNWQVRILRWDSVDGLLWEEWVRLDPAGRINSHRRRLFAEVPVEKQKEVQGRAPMITGPPSGSRTAPRIIESSGNWPVPARSASGAPLEKAAGSTSDR